MRIHEVYEHQPLCRPEGFSAPECGGGCRKQGEQCVAVAVPLTLTPLSGLGPVCTACQGEPTVTCVTEPDGTSCTITFTQKLCISVPVHYGVSIAEGASRIDCGCKNN